MEGLRESNLVRKILLVKKDLREGLLNEDLLLILGRSLRVGVLHLLRLGLWRLELRGEDLKGKRE